jgi:hypothetical protein
MKKSSRPGNHGLTVLYITVLLFRTIFVTTNIHALVVVLTHQYVTDKYMYAQAEEIV